MNVPVPPLQGRPEPAPRPELRPITLLLHGQTGEQKTTRACQLVDALRREGYSVSGIVAHGLRHEGKRSGFDLEELWTGERIPLARAGVDAAIRIGKFGFFPEGIEFGRAALDAACRRRADLIVVDEVGPWELQGDGWAAQLDLLATLGSPMTLTVRTHLLDEVSHRWAGPRAIPFPSSQCCVTEMMAALKGENKA